MHFKRNATKHYGMILKNTNSPTHSNQRNKIEDQTQPTKLTKIRVLAQLGFLGIWISYGLFTMLHLELCLVIVVEHVKVVASLTLP